MSDFFRIVHQVFMSNAPNIVGFALAAAACLFLGSYVAEGAFRRWDSMLAARYKVTTAQRFGEAGDLVGRLERNVFIYAILTEQSGLITTVIILKAFFSWIEWEAPNPESSPDETTKGLPPEKWRHYSLYCGGSLISIGVGIAFGEFGRFVALVVSAYLRNT